MNILNMIFGTIGKIIFVPVCYLLQIMGLNVSDDFKNNSFAQLLIGITSVVAMIVAIYVLPMFKGKKKRKYSRKSSRRKKRK